MGSSSKSKRTQVSPSSEAFSASSSDASSSRAGMEVEEASASVSRNKPAADARSDAEDDDAVESETESSDEDGYSEHESSLRPKIDVAKARTKLHHVAKTLRATAKKTKMFEVQKLVKKLKGLQKKSSLAEQAELAEKELTALKSIDISLLASRALITKMIKAKLLPRSAELENADTQQYVYLQMVKEEELLGEEVLLNDPVVADGDRALERAKAKITSSKVLADEVGKFVDELKRLIGIEPIASKKAETDVDDKFKGKAKQEEDYDENQEEEREWSGSEEASSSDGDMHRHLPLVDDEIDDDEDNVDEQELERIGNEKLKALGDLSQWDDMIGSDSVAGSDSEPDVPSRRKQKRISDDDSSEPDSSEEDSTEEEEDPSSDSDSDSDSSASFSSSSNNSDRPRKRKSSAKLSPKPSKKKAKKASSTFLPSLSTGFIAGRSDDEWSDAEADLADRDLSELKSGGKKERKNRMGQRARKALYEKKYGKNANHIKMREKQKAAKLERAQRSQHPSAGPGAASQQGGRQRPPAFQAPANKDGGWGGPVAQLPKQPKRPFVPRSLPTVPPNAAASSSTSTKSHEMHPSWIAKQKQKELMAQVKPQGKKVVFD